MTVDPNLYAGASLIILGILIGLATPAIIRLYALFVSHATLRLEAKKYQQKVIQGKVPPLQQQAVPGTP